MIARQTRAAKPGTLSKMPDSCVRRKTGTATNSRLRNWWAVPGLPTADTPPVARPIFIPSDEVLPHNATDTRFPAPFAGNWLSVPGFAPRETHPAAVPVHSIPILAAALVQLPD